MKKTVLFLITFFAITIKCLGQVSAKNDSVTFNSMGYLNIIYLPSGNWIQTENLIVDIRNAEVVTMLSRVETIKRYGTITKIGAIVFKLKPNVKLLFINQILDLFNISPDDKSLPIFINDQYVYHPESILADKDQITAIDIIKDPTNENKRTIDIITKSYDLFKRVKSKDQPQLDVYYLGNQEIISIDSFLYNKHR